MNSIDRIIQGEPNPFDTETFWSGNFWQEEQNPDLTVHSIHYEAIAEIEKLIDRIAEDNRTRTLILEGETGSGKTYLLGRIKRTLKSKAFFVYIEPFTASDYIWRHILRYTVDSLLEVPEGEKESQLVKWLQGLSEFKNRSFLDWLRGERQVFIRKLLDVYPTGIYNAQEFFGVLYDLTEPRLANLACEWLRGDDLDEESLRKLGVQNAIESEDAAQKMLANFGRIAAATQPIVLCFDQLDNIARQSDGTIDLPCLFSVNSLIHTQKLKNFLVLISIITDTWKQNAPRVQATDRDRVDSIVQLKQINLDQAEALWASRLYLLHRQIHPQPTSPIYPLTRQHLEAKFPGGKTRPRNTLILGRQLMQAAKMGSLKEAIETVPNPTPAPQLVTEDTGLLAAFKLVWLRKFNQTQQRVTRIRQYATPELIQMLAEAMSAVRSIQIQPRLLPSRTYASYSFSYQLPGQSDRIAIVWTEDLNMVKLYNLLKACEEAIEAKLCQKLQLIRSEGIGTPANQGYKLYQKLFTDSPHERLEPDVTSVCYLVTYHTLVNDALSGELAIGEHTPNLPQLEALVRDAQVLKNCLLLRKLGIFDWETLMIDPEVQELNWTAVEEFITSRAIDQQCIAVQRLVQEAIAQFPHLEAEQIRQRIQHLCESQTQIKILDPQVSWEEQIVYSIE
ncbi:MAG TPA: AAA family ATPase [Oscillatoriales cyanobacterium M59_W2019_021]|nr:MAG: ATP-binding protein [Cyanobacteria bacterium J055]HIK31331.1 AAA family ATPase [Oscillatoriales cyanobacterium M4454_W2019_049]HIK51023.1 AAA family ATPase [Oscillatoriales cyanobacterium M59_W2019_021]